MHEAERSWSDLPTELLEMILARLPLSNHPYFASVCKSWNKISLLDYYPADESPLLVHSRKWRDGVFHYYSPLRNKTFKVDCTLDLSNTRFYFSRDGWLVLYREYEVVLANPLANIMHKFPGIPLLNDFTGIAFTGNPPNDCMIFAIESWFDRYVEISIWDIKGWVTDIRKNNNLPFIMAPHTSPVVYNGRFYCLGKAGNLGNYDPDDEDYTWTVLASPKQFPCKVEESYLIESEGRLLAVVFSNHNTAVQVLRLAVVKQRVVWERISISKAETLCVGPQVSILTTNLPKKMKQTIYSSRLIGMPETIEAEVRYCEGRMFFVRKARARSKPKEGREQATNEGICSYPVQTGRCSRYWGSIEYPCSIWYQPKVVENL